MLREVCRGNQGSRFAEDAVVILVCFQWGCGVRGRRRGFELTSLALSVK